MSASSFHASIKHFCKQSYACFFRLPHCDKSIHICNSPLAKQLVLMYEPVNHILYSHDVPYMPGQPITMDTQCAVCRGDDSQGHIFGSCMHPDISKQYIARHDKAMRTVIQAFTKGQCGSHFLLQIGLKSCRQAKQDHEAHTCQPQIDTTQSCLCS